MMLGNLGIREFGPDRSEPFSGSALVGAEQPRIAGDVGGKDGGKAAGGGHIDPARG